MRYAFCGDRLIAVKVLGFLMDEGFEPLALVTSSKETASHSKELIEISGLNEESIFHGKEISSKECFEYFKALDLDYVIGIHFPEIIKKQILSVPKIGFINLHPAYLPYNKGWHTPSWAILDNSVYGATLHFMAEELDAGDIIHQKKLDNINYETANSLYMRVLDLEFEVFKESLIDLVYLKPRRLKQIHKGTSKKKNDLKKLQKIDLDRQYSGLEMYNLLRALTTNKLDEAAFVEIDDFRCYIQVKLFKKKVKE